MMGSEATDVLKDIAVIEGAYVLTSTDTKTKFAAAVGPGGCTAFTGTLLEVLRTGTDSAGEFLSMERIFLILREQCKAANYPMPKSSGRDTASALALARNPLWKKPVEPLWKPPVKPLLPTNPEEFWEDLLAHIRHQQLVPVVGPFLNMVKVGDAEQTFTTLIGQRLAERYQLTVSPGTTTMEEAVAAFVQERGPDEGERLYRVINNIITELDPAPGNALRNLAAIDDMRLFVSTTPDRLLEQAVNEVRFQSKPGTRELAFSPYQAASAQPRNVELAEETNSVVLNLFGQAASTPEYAIHEEDRFEWLNALMSDAASLPDWLFYRLKHYSTLFIGCDMSDGWLGRSLRRMFSMSRLSHERDK